MFWLCGVECSSGFVLRGGGLSVKVGYELSQGLRVVVGENTDGLAGGGV